jgi:outer membrane immunogenic protein
MKTGLTIAVAAFALGIASPRTAAAQSSFNGGYFGLTTGYGWGTSTQTGLIPPPPSAPEIILDDASFSTRGGLIGGALGWNAQYGAWIFGIEGDYSYAAVSGGSSACGIAFNSCGTRLESLGTVRGRVGTLVNDWMLYATGGFAFGQVSGFSVAKSSGDAMYNGWTIGGGIEKRFAPQWSLKLEYLYTDLGGKDLYQATVPGFPEHVEYKLSSLRLGISYYFEPAAVAAAPMVTKGRPLK